MLAEREIEVFFVIGEAGAVKVDQIGSREIFGCSALVPPYVYTSTTQAKSRIEVLEIYVVALRELFKEDPRLAVLIQEQVIQCMVARIIDLSLGI